MDKRKPAGHRGAGPDVFVRGGGRGDRNMEDRGREVGAAGDRFRRPAGGHAGIHVLGGDRALRDHRGRVGRHGLGRRTGSKIAETRGLGLVGTNQGHQEVEEDCEGTQRYQTGE